MRSSPRAGHAAVRTTRCWKARTAQWSASSAGMRDARFGQSGAPAKRYLYRNVTDGGVIPATTNWFREEYASSRLSNSTGRRPAGFGRSAHKISNCFMP